MRVKNFARFQHFNNRQPPWIKLYRDILDDLEWHELDAVAAKTLVMLWLIASEDKTKQGYLPTTKTLAFRLRMSETDVKKVCIKLSHWLEQGDIEMISNDDIEVISNEYQVDNTQIPIARSRERETEREEERETEAPAKPARFDPLRVELPDCIEPGTWAEWINYRRVRRLACTKPTIDMQVKNLTDWNAEGFSANEIIKNSIGNGWQGLFAPKGQAKPKQEGMIGGLPRHLMLADSAEDV